MLIAVITAEQNSDFFFHLYGSVTAVCVDWLHVFETSHLPMRIIKCKQRRETGTHKHMERKRGKKASIQPKLVTNSLKRIAKDIKSVG